MANVAASVRQRLLNLSKAQQRPFQEVLQFYAMERFLYRLSQSSHVDRFVLKGALMLQVWQSPQSRPTMDIAATFNQRGTPLPQTPLFDDRFAAIKQTQWQAFLHRLGDDVLTEKDFARVLTSIEQFSGTALTLSDSTTETRHWPAGGPWESTEKKQASGKTRRAKS